MTDGLSVAEELYLVVMVAWFAFCIVNWVDERVYGNPDDAAWWARWVFRAPLWPWYTLTWLGRAIGAMTVDAIRTGGGDDDADADT